jgi:cytochrome bd ubiquinol oxidase subunit II
MTNEILFYGVVAVSIILYCVLDGFDLGVGALHLFARNDLQRRMLLNSIGPVWDGNEVWIVVVMGGLFAGFPNAYAAVFSGFYNLFMILIAGLMFRPVAIEFRSKQESKRWRQAWDVVFSLSSLTVAFVMGVLMGNIIEGIPLDHEQNFVGTFSLFFRPYAILIGITAVALFTMHGAIYLLMKTEGETHDVVRHWINKTIVFFIICYFFTSLATPVYMPHMIEQFYEEPFFLLCPLTSLLAIANIPYQVRKGNDGWAFISSCIAIAFLLSLFGIGTYPTIVRSTVNPDFNITIFNSASSEKTLGVLLTVVAIGIPLVFAYGFWVYHIFRGKVKLGKTSY